MYRSAPLLLALLVAACASHQQTDSEVAAANAAAAASDAAAAASDAATCRSYGLQPDTPAFVRCLDKVADDRARANLASRDSVARALKDQPPSWWR